MRRARLLCVALVGAAQAFSPAPRTFSPPFAREPSETNSRFSTRMFSGVKEKASIAETVQDDLVDAPASIVFYDDYLDPSNMDGVVCARGVCVLPEFADELADLVDPRGFFDHMDS